MPTRVVLEVVPKRSFASALDWPGWSRAAKTSDEALEALLEYAPRYAKAARRAKVAFHPPATVRGLSVVETLTGDGGTEFGVPGRAASSESGADAIPTRELNRLLSLLEAVWAAFDAAARSAKDKKLRLGPRGGGRQVPKIIEHVHEAERAYLHQLGTKGPGPKASIADVRSAFLDAARIRGGGETLPDPNKARHPWSPRYAIRRSAWHALDHAWEIEDRAE